MRGINKTLAIYMLFYIIIWAVLPLFFYNSFTLDVDTIDIFHHVQNLDIKSLFVDKHPGLTLIIFKILLLLSPSPFFANLLGSSIFLSLALVYIYKLLRLDYSKDEATLLTILSSCSIFYILRYFIEFNHNLVLLPIWIASVYYFISAIRGNNTKTWIILAFVCALGMYAKFQMALIIIVEFCYLIFKYDKKYLKNLVISFLIFILLMTPEIIGVMIYSRNLQYMFLQIDDDNYGFFLVANNANILLRILAMQLFNVINLFFIAVPVLITLLLVTFKKVKFNAISFTNPLVICGFLPLVVFFIIQTVKGQLPAGWLIVTMSLTFPAFCSLFGLKIINKINFNKLVVILLSLHFIAFVGYNISTFSSKTILTTNYGDKVAVAAKTFWKKHADKESRERKEIYVIDNTGWIDGAMPDLYAYSNNINYKKEILVAYNGCNLSSQANVLKTNGFNVITKECIAVQYANKFKKLSHNVSFFIVKKG
ncbi:MULTISPECIES: glycosyltransferase family 39 protein [unclassified Francisella]|uniref:glycosyltransferase family 39 protein n=1 Tax=unclassified Francisella TaxID=2610885 RepID=UPI002E35B20B|nr:MULTISPECIES: glycosyltransferase family 39 protein [unclassified Francisella]MED7819303.1 glycosyltransferase family 39 protein [Francisella sp. 19S2-4]MED7830067.1 glycosyltransferase family 39 protein [Francisella sp. 19S2-10]